MGTLIADGAIAATREIFISDDKKPVTKRDINELKNMINTRYFEVHNISPDLYGRKAYFDMGTGKIVYYDP